jgi:hypothetical protein
MIWRGAAGTSARTIGSGAGGSKPQDCERPALRTDAGLPWRGFNDRVHPSPNHPMKTVPLLPLLALATLLLAPGSLFAQGPLTPPGAPAPTMKTLDQLEPRTPISSLPYIISNSGSYYLTGNFVVGGSAITLSADGVTLDFKGFTITSTNSPAGGFGIQLSGARRNITIHNGNLRGRGTNIGGSYSGPGFLHGIDSPGSSLNVRVSGMNISGCQSRGINLGTDHSIAVSQCTVRTVGNGGISAGVVSDSVVDDSNGSGITARAANNCIGIGGTGTGLSAEIANNCKGASGTGIGLNATNALNCTGSSSNNVGLNAGTAQNCTGISTNNTGLYAETASNCKGVSTGGTGLYTETASNCKGSSFSGYGLYAVRTATGCFGSSFSGPGLGGNIANSCDASGFPPTTSTYKYNMPP